MCMSHIILYNFWYFIPYMDFSSGARIVGLHTFSYYIPSDEMFTTVENNVQVL
jgi:hypothetical protein